MILRPSSDPNERWPHLALPFCDQVALGNMTQWLVLMTWREKEEELTVSIMTKGFEIFRREVDPQDVATAFRGMSLCDACNVADLINAQFGINSNHGRYQPGLTRAEP